MQAEELAQPPVDGQPVPINAVFQDDFLPRCARVTYTNTDDEASRKVTAHVVVRRVSPRDTGLVIRFDGRVVPGDVTVTDAGIGPLDIVSVGWAG